MKTISILFVYTYALHFQGKFIAVVIKPKELVALIRFSVFLCSESIINCLPSVLDGFFYS